MINLDWDIKASTARCAACEQAFEDGTPFFSRLDIAADVGYTRLDYCLPCWEGLPDHAGVSVWKSVFRKPAPPPEEPIKKETAESLLRTLMETEDADKRNVIFVLAVMLERRRLLVERDIQVREDGLKQRFYEHRKTGETFVITDPNLKLTALEEVQAQVAEMLGGGPSPPAETPALSGDGEDEPGADGPASGDDGDRHA